ANEGDAGRSGGIAGGGWVKSIDAEYQFRAHSPNDNHSYGTGQMLLWQDCVARDRVFRKVFLNPSPSVVGGFADLDTATGAIDGKGICNQEGQQTRVFSLDGTPPKITVTSPVPPQTSYPSDAMLPLSFTADDGPGSGVDASTAANSVDGMSMPIPKILDLFDYSAGIHWYHAQEADTLGNLGTADVPWITVVTASILTNNLVTART